MLRPMPALPSTRVSRTNLPTRRRPTVALALGGGGARGLAHIAILEVFDELGIRPIIIAGTSIGAIYGAAYASGLGAAAIRAHTEETLGQRLDLVRQLFSARAEPLLRLANLLPFRSNLLKPEVLADLVLPSKVARTFADLAIPLLTVATDYHTQEQVVFASGDVRQAVAASMALPAIFSAPVIDGRVLMDGGLVNPLPFDLLAGRADITIAIDVSGAGQSGAELARREPPSPFEALVASSQILQASIVREKLRSHQPDIYIKMPVDGFHVLDFLRFREVLAAAEPAKAELRGKLARLLGAENIAAPPALGAEKPAGVAGPKRRRPPRIK